jgi:hypothetical protein
VTTVAHEFASAAFVTFAGQVISGGCISLVTLTVNDAVAVTF